MRNTILIFAFVLVACEPSGVVVEPDMDGSVVEPDMDGSVVEVDASHEDATVEPDAGVDASTGADAAVGTDAGEDATVEPDAGEPSGPFYVSQSGAPAQRCAQFGATLMNSDDFEEGQIPFTERPPGLPATDFCVKVYVSWTNTPQATPIDFDRDGVGPTCASIPSESIYLVCTR